MRDVTSRRAADFALLALAFVLALFTAHIVFDLGGSGADEFFVDYLYEAIFVGITATLLWRAFAAKEERAIWFLLGLAAAFFTAGDLYYTFGFDNPDDIPFPSIADAIYLCFYPPCYVALGLLLRSRVAQFAPSLWLDGIIAGLTVASVAAALFFQAILDATEGSSAAIATNLAYPLSDFILLALVAGALGASRWRVDRTWGLVLGAFAIYGIADSIYLYQSSIGTYVEGRLLDVAWPLALLLLAVAAWQPTRRRLATIEGWAALVLPPVFALVSIAVLVVNEFGDVTALAVVLAAAALLATLARLALTFRENLAMIFETRRLNNLQREYIEEVGHVVDAAGAVEAQTFETQSLDGVAQRTDALGQLARVFQRMAREIYERERKLKEQVKALQIQIDEKRAEERVSEITETDYFRDLQKRATALRLDDNPDATP
jgi:hypothetical protein